jgi:hypothetical protein
VGLGGRVTQLVSLWDIHGILRFAEQPGEAPVIHFGGPLQVVLFDQHRLMVDREKELVLGVGTRGLGPGTTAYIGYEGVIPEKAYSTAEITYPPQRDGDPPIRERYELKQRC